MESLNKILRIHGLIIQVSNIKGKYLCKICGNVMADAKIFKTCGDSFCGGCITNYMSEGHQNCPNCDTQMNMDVDLLPDVRINKKILNLLVECPQAHCNKRSTIGKLEAHLRSCIQNNGNSMWRELIDDHELAPGTSNPHDNGTMNNNLNLVANENREKDLAIETLKNETVLIHERIETMANEVYIAKEEREYLKAELQRTVLSLENTKDELMETKSDLSRSMINMEIMKDEFRVAKMDIRRNAVNLDSTKDELSREIIKIKQGIDGAKCREFTVEVNDTHLLDKGQRYYSRVFQLSQYYFKIGMHIGTEDRIEFSVYSVRGENVDSLEWPIPFEIYLIIKYDRKIKCHSFSAANSDFEVDYEKPRDESRWIYDSEVEINNFITLPTKFTLNVKRI